MSQQKFGRYIIKGTLGRGAMGMVYLALDPILDRLSAIKVMNTGGEVDEGMRTRFFREAKSAARLRHPNIIAIYEMGEEGKRPFIAMEYVEGEDLKALIEKRTFIPFDQKMRILVQVCEGLSYAHQQGIIHRDIKPANIRIAQNGEVRILDFGLARLGSSDITRTGMLMGTPYYMSPEQVRGVRDLDGRSDLFSVAVLLYELLAYTRPFEAESSTEVCLKIVSEPHTPLSSVLPKVDGDLEGIIDRALSKNRDARQPGCQDLARCLKEYALTVPERLKGLESEVARLEKEWTSCCEASQHLVQLGILEESLLAPPCPTPVPSIDPEETTVYNFSMEAAQRDFGALLLTHARLHTRLDEVRQRLRAAVPLQELFERGNHQIANAELEDCMNTLAQILEMAPQNARALDMQRECQRRLEERRTEEERRARLKQALALASEAFEQGNLAQCIQSASRALQIDPGNNQALDLKQLASDALVRRRKVAELLAAARGFHKTKNYESACEVCEEALGLDPGNAELRLIQQQSEQILTRQKQIRDWLKLANEKLQAGDYLGVLGTTDQLLTLEADLPRALDLQQQAAEALERQLKLEELLAVARGCETSGDFEECLRVCEQALQIGPQNPEILDLRDRTSQALTTQRRVAELLSQAREEVARKEFGPAIETCQEAIGLDPANQTAQGLLKTAADGRHRQHRVGELLALAQSHLTQRNFQACLDATEEAFALDPMHQDISNLHRAALDSLGRARQLEQHLEAARLGDEIEDYARALHHLELALELDGRNAVALEHKRRVAAKLERRNQLHAWLDTARQQLQSENYTECLDSTQRALELNPANQEAHSLSSQATEAHARLEREKRLLTQAERHFETQQYGMAIEVADELLRLNPHHPAARTLKQEAERSQRELDKIKRITELLKSCRALMQKQQFEEALPLASQILDLQPDHTEASELRKKATAALERQRQIHELLQAARSHERADEFELAVEKTKAGLELDPRNSEFLAMQSRAVAAMEHQRRVSSLLSDARLQLNDQRYEASLQASEQLLKLEPDHPEGQVLKRDADAALERLRHLNRLLLQAKAKAKSGLWKECLDVATEGLRLDPSLAELTQLASEASEILDKRRTVQEFLDSGRGQFDRGEFDASLKSAEGALQLSPDSAEAAQLKLDSASALESRTKQEHVNALLAEARKQDLSGDVEACYRTASEGLALEPEHAELKSLHDNAAHILETRRRIQILLERARQQWQAEDFAKVIETAASILTLEPQSAKAAEFKLKAGQELGRRERLKELLNEAKRADKERDHEACLRAAEEGLTLNPGQLEFQRLQSRSRQMIEQIRRVSQLLLGARAEIEAQNYAAAVNALDAALKLEASNTEAAQLKQKAQEGLERQKRLAGLLSNAQRQLKAGQFEECLKSASQGLAIDAGHALLKELSVEAERQLEHRRQIGEGLQRGAGHLQDKEYQKAIEVYEFVLKLAPSQAQAVEGRRQAQEARKRERQLEDCLARAQAALKSKDLEGCHAAAQEGLKLEPGHPVLQDLAKQAVAIIERTRRVKQLWEEASQSQHSGDLPACLRSLDQLLKLEPENAPAQELRPKIVDALERQRRATGLLAEASSLENSGDLEACQRLVEQALQTDPHHAQAQQFHRKISVALDRGRQIQKLLGQATQQFKEQDDAGAVKTAEEILKLEPEQPQALEIRSLASKRLERRTQVEQLLLQARNAEAARDPEKCLRAAEQGLQLEPDHVEFKKLEAQSRQQLERQRKVRELVAECERQLSAGVFEASIATASTLESLDPGNTIAAEIRQKANDALERRRRVQALLARALEHSAAGDMAACHSLCSEALQLDPSNRELLELRDRTFGVLESRRREEELRARLQHLLASAKDSLQSGRFRAAQKDLSALLKLDAAHAEACQLLADAESQLALARQKNLRLAKLAAAAVLVVSVLGSAVWYTMQALRQPPGAPSSQATSDPTSTQSQPATPQQRSERSAEDREIARLLDASRTFLNEKKYSEAEEAAHQLLVRSPNHEDAKKISQEARKNLDAVNEGLKRAQILMDRRQYAEVASVLGGVLSVDADQPEALRMMAQVDKFAKKNAEEARQKMQQIKKQAGQAGAPTLVQRQYEIASVMESQARQLFEGKKYGEATGKFYEASDAYMIAAGGARAAKAAEIARQPSTQEKPAGREVPSPPAPEPAERQLQEERDRQRNLAQSAWNDYVNALSRASQKGAERLVPDIFHQATSLGTHAQEKFNQGNYTGAQSDFSDALRLVENAITRADDVARQRRDEEAKQKERSQAEALVAQNRRQPPLQDGASGQKPGDRELILQVLKRYEAAMNNRNLRDLGEVRPGLAREEHKKLEESFKIAKSLRYELHPAGELRISEDSAVVNCRSVSETLMLNSSKPLKAERDITVILRKKGGNWIIETMQ